MKEIRNLLLLIVTGYGLLMSLPGFSQVKINSFTNDLSPSLNGQEVIFNFPLTVCRTYYNSPSGGVILSPDRLFSPTEIALPGSDAIAQASLNGQRKLTLNSSTYSYTDANQTLRTGSRVNGLRGFLYYNSGAYSLTPTVQPSFSGNERTASPGTVGNCNLRVASFNVEYYIAKDSLWGKGYGADNQAEFDRQRAKILAALKGLDADIYALCEVGQGNTSVIDLVNGLNALTSSNVYTYVADNDYKESTYTKNVFIYNKNKVTPYNSITFFGSGGYRLRQVAQGFELKSNGEKVIICVNHLKSKSGGGTGADADTGDGQGSSNYTRVTQAQLIVNTLNKLVSSYNDPDVLVVGDMNAYSMEDPIKVLTDNGLVNQLKRFSPEEYSYVYQAEAGFLDHSLATATLSKQVTGARPWHINADEPGYFDYKSSAYFSADPYRSSDHDPVLTGISLGNYNTGIEGTTLDKGQQLLVYGNLSNGYLTLSAEWIDRVELFTVGGRLLYSSVNEVPGPNFLLSIAQFSKGFYLVRAFNGKKAVTSRLVL